ncbi:ABC transporter ATP-binding protein [Microbacterium sp. NPDC064584]|uniref:sulfate/molybdate ABC transporter ATP-binding protein n=1 Tax=Microbacterium sp. NPDC064584 TaxID=3155817 RepID=UPI00341E9616
MTLVFSATLDARGVALDLEVALGETVAVLGPNGAGKSTLLGMIAGLVQPDAGHADLDGAVLFDLTGGRGRWTPPHARGVSTLTQDADLFPHLSVLENVAFGARSKGLGRRRAQEIARHWLDEVEATELAQRRPSELSGGQAQRVAIARALAADPHLLLLDEPLSALDVAVAPTIRRTLLRVLRERTAIIVTHDVLDALTLADRVIVLSEGRIVEEGPTRATFARPRTGFTAGLAGLNLLTGIRTAEGMITDAGIVIRSTLPTDAAVHDRVVATVRPGDVAVASAATTTPGVDRILATVLDLEPRGDLIRVRSDTISADLAPAEVADGDLEPGMRVGYVLRPETVTITRA